MANKITWPLAVSTFTTLDKLKISWFLFSEPMWTYGKWVRKYEEMWEKKFGLKHAILVSSGSTANELIALRRKHELEQAGQWPRRNKVLFPVNTWISSVSPWINMGFEPVFADPSLDTLNVTPKTINDILDKDYDIGTVFYTTILGLHDDVYLCKLVAESHGVKLLLDNCESSFSYYDATPDGEKYKKTSILKLATCSTSIFFSHLTMSGTEGGLVFTESDEEADWFRMARSHGLTRGMPEKYKNPEVNPDFDFYLMGTNYRSSNLQAYMAMLDFERAYEFSNTYRMLYCLNFFAFLDPKKYSMPRLNPTNVLDGHYCPLAIPIVCSTKEHRQKIEQALKQEGVITRPLIGGCLLAHTAFKKYGKIEDFPNAKFLHENAIYIGLNTSVNMKKVSNLINKLNSIE